MLHVIQKLSEAIDSKLHVQAKTLDRYVVDDEDLQQILQQTGAHPAVSRLHVVRYDFALCAACPCGNTIKLKLIVSQSENVKLHSQAILSQFY